MILNHLIQLGVGRILLSWLPPGRLGGHRPIELPATLGASYLLGGVALQFQGALLQASPFSESYLARLSPWVVLLAVRLATLPGYFVAGAEPRHEERGPLFWVLTAVAALALLGQNPSLERAAFCACASHLLWQGRRRPIWRAGWVAFFALVVPRLPGSVWVEPRSLLFGLGGAFLVPWIRRNDFRGAALSGAFVLGASLGPHPSSVGPWPMACVGALTLMACSRPLQRRFAMKVAGAMLAASAVPVVALSRLPGPYQGDDPGALDALWIWVRGFTESFPASWIAAALVVGATFLRARSAKPWSAGEIEEPVREGWTLGLLSGLMLLSGFPSAPLVLLWLGVLFLPQEKVPGEPDSPRGSTIRPQGPFSAL